MTKLSEGELDAIAYKATKDIIENCGGPNAECLVNMTVILERVIRNLDLTIATMAAEHD